MGPFARFVVLTALATTSASSAVVDKRPTACWATVARFATGKKRSP
jgi:hypothetical protein